MSAFAEFFLIAFAIYLWESGHWLPTRSVVLRRNWFGGKWKAIKPGQWMSTRELGLVPMIPFLPDRGLAPCQSPPLLADPEGNVFAEIAGSELVRCDVTGWEDLHETPPRLTIDGAKVRLSSPRSLDRLRNGKKAGESPAEAIGNMWRTALSPQRAKREWERWQMVSKPLRPVCLLLTAGFFGGLPLTFVYAGMPPTLMVAAVLWLLMWVIAIRLWWMGGRVYPSVRSAFRSDAMLSVFVPFHAMRAMETASVHAMAQTHPAALILSTEDLENPWLASFIREISHPRPDAPHDEARTAMIRPLLVAALARSKKEPDDYETVPSRSDDDEAAAYCPRCHSLFGRDARACPDCRGILLKAFD